MARKDSVADLLLLMPWWALLALSASLYGALKWVLPMMEFENRIHTALAQGVQPISWLPSTVLVIFAVLSFLRSAAQRRLVESHQSLAEIRDMPWQRFEELVAEIFKRRGYTVVRGPTDGPDGGVDVTLRKDGDLALVQCKKWRNKKIGVSIVRELYGVMAARKASKGFVVCCGDFTQDARAFARENGVELITGPDLLRFAQQVNGAKSPETFAANDDSCPVCQSEMVLRTATRGENAGSRFYGCSQFPKCRGTRAA